MAPPRIREEGRTARRRVTDGPVSPGPRGDPGAGHRAARRAPKRPPSAPIPFCTKSSMLGMCKTARRRILPGDPSSPYRRCGTARGVKGDPVVTLSDIAVVEGSAGFFARSFALSLAHVSAARPPGEVSGRVRSPETTVCGEVLQWQTPCWGWLRGTALAGLRLRVVPPHLSTPTPHLSTPTPRCPALAGRPRMGVVAATGGVPPFSLGVKADLTID